MTFSITTLSIKTLSITIYTLDTVTLGDVMLNVVAPKNIFAHSCLDASVTNLV